MPKKPSKNKRVVVAMSGGVDSSVAAYLLKKQGYDVIGIFLKLWVPPCYDSCEGRKQNLCCDDKALAVAREVADKLQIPFYVLKVDNLFKKEIVDNFISEYEKGRTPNPCVRCNKYIKFGYLWQKAMELGADYLSTGHYIDLRRGGPLCPPGSGQTQGSTPTIARSKDLNKDQTYFLSGIDSAIIPHLLFPLGNMEKSEVREIAKKAKLPAYNKKESMGICFIPDGDSTSFLSTFGKKLKKPGQIVDKYGSILGRHEGLLGYTVGEKVGDDVVAAKYMDVNYCRGGPLCPPESGQTQGFAPTGKNKSDVPRLYVISIDAKKNQLVVGENRDCFSDVLVSERVNIVNERFFDLIKKNNPIYAQIRGGHKAEECRISLIRPEPKKPQRGHFVAKSYKLQARFAKPVRAITPGQTVAFYDEKGVLLGGGLIG